MNRLPAHRGFSLIEAAIVLGIVGLVIGGIWVAAAAAQEQNRIAQYQKDVMLTIQTIRKLYTGQDVSGTQFLVPAMGFTIGTTSFTPYSGNYFTDTYGNLVIWGVTGADSTVGFTVQRSPGYFPVKTCMKSGLCAGGPAQQRKGTPRGLYRRR